MTKSLYSSVCSKVKPQTVICNFKPKRLQKTFKRRIQINALQTKLKS